MDQIKHLELDKKIHIRIQLESDQYYSRQLSANSQNKSQFVQSKFNTNDSLTIIDSPSSNIIKVIKLNFNKRKKNKK